MIYWCLKRLLVAGAVVLAWTVMVATVWATTIRLVSLDELTQGSSDVVVGDVRTIQSFWNRDRSAILTRVIVRRRQVLRGDPPSELVIFLPGGSVEGKTSLVIGAPEFRRNQQVVVFLNRVTDLSELPPDMALRAGVVPFHLSNLFQGMFDIVVDRATGRRMAINNAVRLFDPPPPQPGPELLALGGQQGLSLSELVTQVRRIR